MAFLFFSWFWITLNSHFQFTVTIANKSRDLLIERERESVTSILFFLFTFFFFLQLPLSSQTLICRFGIAKFSSPQFFFIPHFLVFYLIATWNRAVFAANLKVTQIWEVVVWLRRNLKRILLPMVLNSSFVQSRGLFLPINDIRSGSGEVAAEFVYI